MDKDSIEALRFDLRLAKRGDQVEQPGLDAYLEVLPDVSDKIQRDDEAGAAAPAAGEPPPEASSTGE